MNVFFINLFEYIIMLKMQLDFWCLKFNSMEVAQKNVVKNINIQLLVNIIYLLISRYFNIDQLN